MRKATRNRLDVVEYGLASAQHMHQREQYIYVIFLCHLALEKALKSLEQLRARFRSHIGTINGKGLVWAICLTYPATKKLHINLAEHVTTGRMGLGLLVLQTGRGTLKIAPPLRINEEALSECS